MTKTLAIALALSGAVWLGASASANAATKADGLSNTTVQTGVAEDMSAAAVGDARVITIRRVTTATTARRITASGMCVRRRRSSGGRAVTGNRLT